MMVVMMVMMVVMLVMLVMLMWLMLMMVTWWSKSLFSAEDFLFPHSRSFNWRFAFFVFSYFKFFQVSEVKDAFTDLGNLFGHHIHLKKSHNIWFINQKSGKLWGRSMWEISSMGEKLKNTIEKKSPIWEKNGKKISPVLTKSSQPFLL